MRRIFTYALMLCCLIISSVASAAQVTDAKWGVSADNVVRIVIDSTAPVTYSVDAESRLLTLTVDAPYKEEINCSEKVRSTLVPSMQTVSMGDKTVIKLALTKQITAADYKSFTLKADPTTKRPDRVVLDITAAKSAAANNTVAANTSSSVKAPAVVSSKPVVSNKPTAAGSVPVVVKPVVKTDTDKKDRDKDKEKEDKKEEKKETPKKEVIKSDGKYRTSGGLKGKIITLDPGHGGSDPGAVGANGTKEKNITLAIAEKVEELLKKRGAKVYMTRTTDKDVFGPYASDVDELQARVNVAEKHDSDLFVSLHINSSVNKKIGGFSTFYYPKTSQDLKIAKAIQDQLTSNFGVDDLGVREANFYVIKRSSMPATLLELCFISNPKEEKLMNSKWFQNKTAKLIAEGIEEYFE